MSFLKAEKLSKSFETFQGSILALDQVTFELPEAACTLIVGENGSGKSLLMSILAGLEMADSGETTFDSKRVGLVFQEAETQILGETPREDIAFGLKNLGWNKEKIEVAVEKALKESGLSEKADYPARFMSGGEKRRLAIACMLAMDFPIIILDEPYANLDYMGVKQVNNLILNLKKANKTLIILTHEVEKCMGLAEKLIVLFKGRVVFEGTPKEGIKQNLEAWNIKNPMTSYNAISDLIW